MGTREPTASKARSVAFTKSVFRGCAGWSLRLLVDAGALDGYSVPSPSPLPERSACTPALRRPSTRPPALCSSDGHSLVQTSIPSAGRQTICARWLVITCSLSSAAGPEVQRRARESIWRLWRGRPASLEIGLGSEPQAPSAELVGRALGLTGAHRRAGMPSNGGSPLAEKTN